MTRSQMAFHPWRPRQSGDDPQSFGLEHLPERGGEERIAIMNQESQRAEAVTQVHGQVPSLLHRPCPRSGAWSPRPRAACGCRAR